MRNKEFIINDNKSLKEKRYINCDTADLIFIFAVICIGQLIVALIIGLSFWLVDNS